MLDARGVADRCVQSDAAADSHLLQAFNLTSNTVVQLEEDAVIRGTSDTTGNDYPLLVIAEVWRWFGTTYFGGPGCAAPSRFLHSPLLFAWHQHNISVRAVRHSPSSDF